MKLIFNKILRSSINRKVSRKRSSKPVEQDILQTSYWSLHAPKGEDQEAQGLVNSVFLLRMHGEAPRGGAPLPSLPTETQGSLLPRVSAPRNQHPEPQPEHFWHLKCKNWLHTRKGANNIHHIKQVTVRLSKPFIVTNPKSYDFRCTHLRDLPIFSGFSKRRKKLPFSRTLCMPIQCKNKQRISHLFSETAEIKAKWTTDTKHSWFYKCTLELFASC